MKIDCTGYVINPTDNEETNLLINYYIMGLKGVCEHGSFLLHRQKLSTKSLQKKSLEYFGKLVFKYLEVKDSYLPEEYSRHELKISHIA